MKKFLIFLVASMFVCALFIPEAVAKKKAKKVKPKKVEVCHVIAANDVITFGPVLLYFGKVKKVSESALDAHIDHGDWDSFWGGEEAAGPIDAFREAGAHLPAANCYFGVNDDGPYGPLE